MRKKRKYLIKGSVWRSGEAECVKLDLIEHGASGEDVVSVLRRGVANSTGSLGNFFLIFVCLPRLLKRGWGRGSIGRLSALRSREEPPHRRLGAGGMGGGGDCSQLTSPNTFRPLARD